MLILQVKYLPLKLNNGIESKSFFSINYALTIAAERKKRAPAEKQR